MHYRRVRKHGQTDLPSPAQRFWALVDIRGGDDCWEWQGKRASNGYGVFNLEYRHRGAHRMAWELHYGAPPGDLLVCHRCDNRACVRPDHLFLGTQKDNLADMKAKGRASLVRARGEATARAKLTEVEVREIRRRANAGEPQTVIACDYGVTKECIHSVVHRKTWKHVA